MKLSPREIDLISDISRSRRMRGIGAWVALGIVLFGGGALMYLNVLADSSSIVIGIFLGVAITNVASAHSNVRADDKLIDILQRYVNSDPEALQQLSSSSREFAA